MKLLKSLWRTFIVLILVLSLVMNIAFFVGGSLYQVASSAIRATTGIRTMAVQHADEVAQLRGKLATERAATRNVRGELSKTTTALAAERATTRKLKGDLSGQSKHLSTERTAKKKLTSELFDSKKKLATAHVTIQNLQEELADPLSQRVVYRGEKIAVRDAVDSTANRISKRAVVTSSRSVGSMAAEAIPYIGVAAIVGVTAMELKDLCDTLKDIGELQRAISPEKSLDEKQRLVCAMRVPTREELWESMKSSPKTAWTNARNAIPTLEEVKSVKFPDVDWEGLLSGALARTGDAWEATKSGVSSAGSSTMETGKGIWERLWDGEPIEEAE